jgi:hypothetical protein
MGAPSHLPTLAEMAATRYGKAIPKGKSRLEVRIDQKPLTVVDERAFKAEVWTRDQGRCRCCKRKVVKGLLKRVPERGEVNHIHGRVGDLRFDARAALLLCLLCHEKVTGRVNEKIVIVPSKTFRLHDTDYADARAPVTFKRVA